jgi:hypothetical protein
MPHYQVIVHETVELTYDIEAGSPIEAKRKWVETPDLPESSEESLGCELVMVITPAGEQIEDEELVESAPQADACSQ